MEGTFNKIVVVVAVAVCWAILVLVRASDAFRPWRGGGPQSG